MSNNVYLDAISSIPSSSRQRPDRMVGLSEWPYYIPFLYLLLLSGNPQRVPSLLFDDLDDTPVYALVGEAEVALKRGMRFLDLVSCCARRSGSHELLEMVEEARLFLDEHRDEYFLLETIEVDSMLNGPEDWCGQVEATIVRARATGQAVDALWGPNWWAARQLAEASQNGKGRLEPFKGLRLDDDFDNTRDGKTDHPIGLSWWT